MAITVTQMTVQVPQTVLDDLQDRLVCTHWPGEIPGSGWQRRADLAYMKELVEYWNVGQFTEFPKGCHFAIYERAEELVDDIFRFFRSLRKHENHLIRRDCGGNASN